MLWSHSGTKSEYAKGFSPLFGVLEVHLKCKILFLFSAATTLRVASGTQFPSIVAPCQDTATHLLPAR